MPEGEDILYRQKVGVYLRTSMAPKLRRRRRRSRRTAAAATTTTTTTSCLVSPSLL
jgi:hypothetical protein